MLTLFNLKYEEQLVRYCYHYLFENLKDKNYVSMSLNSFIEEFLKIFPVVSKEQFVVDLYNHYTELLKNIAAIELAGFEESIMELHPMSGRYCVSYTISDLALVLADIWAKYGTFARYTIVLSDSEKYPETRIIFFKNNSDKDYKYLTNGNPKYIVCNTLENNNSIFSATFKMDVSERVVQNLRNTLKAEFKD